MESEVEAAQVGLTFKGTAPPRDAGRLPIGLLVLSLGKSSCDEEAGEDMAG